MEPVSLCAAVDLQEQVQISPQAGEEGGVSQQEARHRVAEQEASQLPKTLFSKSPILQMYQNYLHPKKLPLSEKCTAISIHGKVLAAFKDFMKLFFEKSSRKMKPRRDFTMNPMSHFQQDRN